MNVVCCEGRGLSDELITRPEESYRVCHFDKISCNNNPLHLQLGRSSKAKKEIKRTEEKQGSPCTVSNRLHFHTL